MLESSKEANQERKRKRLEEMVKAVVAGADNTSEAGCWEILNTAQYLISIIDEKMAADIKADEEKFKGGAK
jgi:hypothetical protein